MVAIKKIGAIAVIAAVAWSVSASAQENVPRGEMHSDGTYRALVAAMDEAKRQCDSLVSAVDAKRGMYAAADGQRRSELGQEILALESEMIEARTRYDRRVAEVADFERMWIVQNKDGNAAQTDTPAEGVTEGEGARMHSSPNLVFNRCFAGNLPESDYRVLCRAQSDESAVAASVGEYSGIYASMLALQREYMSAETEPVADSLMSLFSAARARAAKVDRYIAERWSPVFDNKIYSYNLVLEKMGRNDVLSEVTRITDNALRNTEENEGLYDSDGLMRYYIQKRGLTECESAIASALGLTSASDSLRKVSASLAQTDFRLPKLSIEKRYFIDYEPLKVIHPTIYNSKNPVPRTKIYEHGTIYRIRIGIFVNRPNLSALRGITPLSYSTDYHNGRNAYFVGGFRTEKEASEGVAYLKRIGFKDPTVVMWIDGKYVPDLAEWAKNNAREYTIEISGVATLSDKVKSVILAENENCEFSRVGSMFVVGKFSDKAAAERVAGGIAEAEPQAAVKINEVVKP